MLKTYYAYVLISFYSLLHFQAVVGRIAGRFRFKVVGISDRRVMTCGI